jgi:hypothetical protein
VWLLLKITGIDLSKNKVRKPKFSFNFNVDSTWSFSFCETPLR